MGFTTKQKLDDSKFEQVTGKTMTLSGETVIDGIEGNMKFSSHKIFDDPQQVVDKQYVDERIAVVSGDSIYRLGSPATVQVGGVDIGHVLTGLTSNEILEDILYPELIGTLTPPSHTSIDLVDLESIYEVGCSLSFNVTGVFNRGSINPQYDSASPFRSGVPNTYNWSGSQVSSSACTNTTASASVSSYITLSGSNSWSATISYDQGVQPVSNFGNNYDSQLNAGTTTPSKSDSFDGVYPYFWGISASPPVANSALLTTAIDKCVVCSSGTIEVNNGSNTSYVWFATPSGSTTKQGWFEGAANNGNIGIAPGDIFGEYVGANVDSPDNCWTNQPYKFYSTTAPIVNGGTTVCYTNAKQQ